VDGSAAGARLVQPGAGRDGARGREREGEHVAGEAYRRMIQPAVLRW
jgi:hypothetical protein